MAIIKPFPCIRPDSKVVKRVAALPYDVYNRMEAKREYQKEPLSFLKIDRPEIQFDDSVDAYDPVVYEKAKETLESMIEKGIFLKDQEEAYYIYELIKDSRSQTGVAACSSIDDYLNHVIKKHENTREDKEIDRIQHINITNAHTGPVFLVYPKNQELKEVITKVKKEQPVYNFTASDGVHHNVWKISDKGQMSVIYNIFKKMDHIYIADGHHRAVSAVKVGSLRRENSDYTGKEGFNYFLSVLFPDDELMILPYNRIVKDLNGLTENEFIDRIRKDFTVELTGREPYLPDGKACFGMYLNRKWYKLIAKEALKARNDSVRCLDVSLLQDYILQPVLNIEDPRTDKRIDFIGGIRGTGELEKRVDEEDMAVAFSMYPTSIQELFAVADEGRLMPPKSTWFEPKLRSGIFIHSLT